MIAVTALAAALSGCATANPTPPPHAANLRGFHSGPCNFVSDDEVSAVAGAGRFTKTVDNDVGCFWQENSTIGGFGEGMGISTWWYRGSDMDTERELERKAGRRLANLSLNGNSGFEASDANACSVYVAKGGDMITWSVQTLNPSRLPDLCSLIRRLAQLTQDRVN